MCCMTYTSKPQAAEHIKRLLETNSVSCRKNNHGDVAHEEKDISMAYVFQHLSQSQSRKRQNGDLPQHALQIV